MQATIDSFVDFKRRYPIRPADPTTWLGSGSYGRVVKVEDQVETEWVAVKISEYQGNDSQSLRAEVELAQRIPRHANIARYDTCYRLETDASVSDFAVMKYYRDGNLARLLGHETLTPDQIHDLTRGILLGLQHLHNQQIIHRDFKPANILISRDNGGRLVPKIADFGLSRQVQEEPDSDRSGFDLSDRRGTPAYKAPEQIMGGRAGFNLDLWAFGVVLYELLLGEKPFVPDSVVEAGKVAPRPLERVILEAKLPPRLEQVPEPYQTLIRRCLVRDPNQRVRRADELLMLLGPTTTSALEANLVGEVPAVSEELTDVYAEEQTDLYGQTELTELLTDVSSEPTVRSKENPIVRPQQPPARRRLGVRTWWWLLPVLLGSAVLYTYLFGMFGVRSVGPQPLITAGAAGPVIESGTSAEPEATNAEKASNQWVQQTRTAFYRQQYTETVRLADVGLKQIPQQPDLLRLKASALERLNARISKPRPTSPDPATLVAATPAITTGQLQQQYNDLIEQGTKAIDEGNKKADAIAAYTDARRLAEKHQLDTKRGHERYLHYLEKGDRIFDRDSRQGAMRWYQVAQAIDDTEEIKERIRQCD